jgi:hypothetical protein
MTNLIHPAIARAQAAEIALAADGRRHAAQPRRADRTRIADRGAGLRRFAAELLQRRPAAQTG